MPGHTFGTFARLTLVCSTAWAPALLLKSVTRRMP
jgi:hypothetical protein